MAAMPKRRRMKASLLKRARAEIGTDGTALDYVCEWIASGGLIKDLATSLEEELGEPVSRSILSTLAHHLAPDASSHIAEARRAAATALVEDAVRIADDASDTSSAGIAKAKLRVDTRTWLATRWDQASYGEKSSRVAVELNLGQLHLEALRAHNLERRLQTPAAVVEVIPKAETALLPRLLAAGETDGKDAV